MNNSIPTQLSKILHRIDDPATLDAIDWEPYGADGRSNVLIHRLYDTRTVEEHGPAAALLWYKPGASVRRHMHSGYELIYVLDGVLSNDAGDHPPGTLEICPPGSTHQLASKDGCKFLVVWERPVHVMAEQAPV
jgi:anti-sigma factor ChrR (cupin superfamily)